MSWQRPVQHIDRKDLYTNLEARIQYLHTFLDFSSNDIEALISGSKYIKALIPAVVNIVYHKLLQYDITARAFQTRSTSFEGPLDEFPDENSPQILHRKMFLRGYLNRLCSDPSKLEFWEYLDKVGMMHVGRGREHPLHIEYVHIGACLSFIQDVLTEALLSHPRLPLQRKIALVKAIGKVIWIQNDLFAKWYVKDGEEFADETAQIIIEREGYLHGKKVIAGEGSGSESESDKEKKGNASSPKSPTSRIPVSPKIPVSPSSSGSCPFQGMAKGVAEMKVQDGRDADAQQDEKVITPPRSPTRTNAKTEKS
ncbi:Protoglobin-domain-containing protein [Paecilomyces variotii]|uniref:Protoglobin-domain-containing protein n=1 Tax=Byssochlamys spectabilis TaxID=264951 RepID=A0A443I396_BYSSP|nr:Protoglobin-domain-containing protein [Paecilomyces variotii]KAJ9224933.1 hypothetical protein DTO169C6_2853 [Paecilomyces variotii]KAJ9286544.1 hypothetical protein DTO021C3_5892 [Paecilomyces variotii]KAJ9354722.1 hypothetical protein DTO280E4_6787 [Paecilomyces variotii]KAJ9401826.1 hypothetical protein DTO282F9_1116 [Paecilomyces variotii]RWQ98532.1 Protoglobin-domain-containing protein [Paecilomyces variotii]